MTDKNNLLGGQAVLIMLKHKLGPQPWKENYKISLH